MTAMSDASGATAWDFSQFDVSGIVNQTTTISGLSYDVTKTQTPGGRITQMVYPSGRSVDYARSACTCAVSGVSTTFGGATSTLLADLSYRPAGLPTAMDIGNSGTVNVDNRYDEAGRLTLANPGTVHERSYSFDANGNHVGIKLPSQPWMDQQYTYDSLGRIRSAVGGFGFVDFGYDKVGNRTKRTVNGQTESYAYVAGTNRIDRITGGSSGTVDFGYDGHGNTTQMGTRNYTYDQVNRLVRAEVDGLVAQYQYNGLGQRVVKTVDGESTFFVYDVDGRMIAEMPGGDAGLGKEHLYNGKALLAQVDVESGAIFTYHTNYLGAVHQLTDNNGTVVWEGVYQPYGEVNVNAGSVVINNWRMPGQYFDAETGLHYNYHRYYDAGIGRYLTPDPIGLDGGINLYAYASNNPVDAFDPDGLTMKTGNPSATAAALNAAGCVKGGSIEEFERYYLIYSLIFDPDFQQRLKDIQLQLMADVTLGFVPMLYGMPPMSIFRPNGASFQRAVGKLSEIGQLNVRALQRWAKSKGWIRKPGNRNGPEVWGVKNTDGSFSWRLKIKPEASTRPGLQAGSHQPRFDARLDTKGAYVNPFTGQTGGKNVGTHIPLEAKYY